MGICGCISGPGANGCSACGAPGWGTSGGGYSCAGCGQWVPVGSFHSCFRPPPYTPPVTVHYVPLTEERIREIVREEIERSTA